MSAGYNTNLLLITWFMNNRFDSDSVLSLKALVFVFVELVTLSFGVVAFAVAFIH